MWGLFLLLVAFGDEPAKDAEPKADANPAKILPATAQNVKDADPAEIAKQLSDILSMLQAIPTEPKAEEIVATVEDAKADTSDK